MVEITAEQIGMVLLFAGGVVTALGVERVFLALRSGRKGTVCPRCGTVLERPLSQRAKEEVIEHEK